MAAWEVRGRPKMVAVSPAFVRRVLREVDEKMAELSSLTFDAWRDEVWTMALMDRVWEEVRDGEKADARPVVERRKVITAESCTMVQL